MIELTQLAYWLLPAEPSAAFFRRTVEELGSAYRGPCFEPHLTLGSGPLLPATEVQSTLARVARNFAPIELQILGVADSERFTQCVYAVFSPNAEFTSLLHELEQDCLLPHLSLIYARLAMSERARLRSTISLPFATVVFDRITAIQIPALIENKADVECWREACPPVQLATSARTDQRAPRVRL